MLRYIPFFGFYKINGKRDLLDITDILEHYYNRVGFDRNKAEEIIRRNNTSDPVVYARNSDPVTTIPLSCASDQTIIENLAFLHSYLSVKLIAEYGKRSQKG